MSVRVVIVVCVLAAGSFGTGRADTAPDRAVALLNERCTSCHGDTVAMSDLRLTSREAALQGGKRGAAIVPGQSAASRLYLAVSHKTDPAMPPGKALSAEELAILKDWIDAGAPWTGARAAQPASKWWAFQKPKQPAVPPVQDAWIRTPIDSFILDKLASQHLKPAKEADRLTLIRRATYDLHGLPPTSAEVSAFVSDSAPDAYEKLIDRLLASPRYGEKWGRHWLDLVRYGDTSGFEQDPYLLEAWRYRDYVIKSLNADKPYDRFVKEQIAGDELWPEDSQSAMGTGFYCVGPNRDMLFKVEDLNRIETLTDFVDTTSSVFLGLSVGCARCHDHKFDPIPQRDYYRMQAIFAPFQKTRVFMEYNAARFYDIAENTRQIKLRDIGAEISRISARARKKLRDAKMANLPAEVQAALNTEAEKRTPEQEALAVPNEKRVSVSQDEWRAELNQEERERLQSIEKRLVGLFASFGPPPTAPGLTDVGREAPITYIAVRGNPKVLGDRVEPGFLSALGGGDVKQPPIDAQTTGRRRALAEWIANPENPLTARVMANRIWQFHFGRGLVATPSDFGTRGSAPSHPELLDWLANEFVARGWSMKQMHKLIMMSAVYRQSSNASEDATRLDPQNTYLSHMNRRRLESEEIRDAVLAVSGDLSLKMEGMPVVPPLDKEELYGIIGNPENAWVVTSNPEEHNRRSIYMISRRAFKMPMFDLFDSPDGILPCPRREASTIAPQSLTMLNGRFTVQQARSLAAKLAKLPESERVPAAWQHVLSRQPAPAEQTAAEKFLTDQAKLSGSPEAALTELARSLFNVNEFLYVD